MKHRLRIAERSATRRTVPEGAASTETLDLALRLGPDGVRVNAVVPGYVEGTEFFGDRMTPERRERLIARSALGRAGTPNDVAGAVVFLASEDATYVTGQLLHVNGGALFGR